MIAIRLHLAVSSWPGSYRIQSTLPAGTCSSHVIKVMTREVSLFLVQCLEMFMAMQSIETISFFFTPRYVRHVVRESLGIEAVTIVVLLSRSLSFHVGDTSHKLVEGQQAPVATNTATICEGTQNRVRAI